MTIPNLPDWLPWWVPIAVLVPALLYALAFVSRPFAVFGVKGRLEAVEARLDEIQGEIRSLSLRLPEPVRLSTRFDETIYEPPPPPIPPLAQPDPVLTRPPIPPAPYHREEEPEMGLRAPRRAEPTRSPRPDRAEPRLNWPR